MTEYEQAEQDVAAAKVAERIAEWKAMEAKAAYYRYASEAMAASAEVMGSRIRRDNALAAEFVEKATRASQAPAQPLDELRSVPGAEEESRDQSCTCHPDDAPPECQHKYAASECRAAWDADLPTAEDVCGILNDDWQPTLPDAEITVADLDKLATKATDEERAEMEREIPEQLIITSPAPEGDLWQQGYDDRKNGFDPSLGEPDYLKGYEARKAVEDEQKAVAEQARVFGEGMIADADRHAKDERGIIAKAFSAFKREREDA